LSKHIDYAKSKSYATLRNEDPDFVPPTAANASALLTQNGKRTRDADAGDERQVKREKADDSDEEMEIDDEEELPGKTDFCTSCYLRIPFKQRLHMSFPEKPQSQPACPRRSSNHRLAFCVQIYLKKLQMLSFLCYSNSTSLNVSDCDLRN
jgi:hypothetical protein